MDPCTSDGTNHALLSIIKRSENDSQFMEKNGNTRHKEYYEAALTADFIRPSHQDHKAFHQFLYNKYILLRFISPIPVTTTTTSGRGTLIHVPNTTIFTSNDISSSTTAHDEYKCERDGGEKDQHLDQFLTIIGEKRKVILKEQIGPIEFLQEQEKQSLKMKQEFVTETKRKEEQYARSLLTIHLISQQKKDLNKRKERERKQMKEKEEIVRKEMKAKQTEERAQKRSEAELRRQEKKVELKQSKSHLYYSGLRYGTSALRKVHSFHDPNLCDENNTLFPPAPRQPLLHKMDKRGLKYSVSEK
jgi:hypothetical protein